MGLVQHITPVGSDTYHVTFHQYRPQLPGKTASGTLTIHFPASFTCGTVVTGDSVGLELYSAGELVALEPIEHHEYTHLLREAHIPPNTPNGSESLSHQHQY